MFQIKKKTKNYLYEANLKILNVLLKSHKNWIYVFCNLLHIVVTDKLTKYLINNLISIDFTLFFWYFLPQFEINLFQKFQLELIRGLWLLNNIWDLMDLLV